MELFLARAEHHLDRHPSVWGQERGGRADLEDGSPARIVINLGVVVDGLKITARDRQDIKKRQRGGLTEKNVNHFAI